MLVTHPIVGRVEWEPAPGDRIQLLNDWVAKNIVTVNVPELNGVPTYGGPFNGKVLWYRGCVDQLRSVFDALERQGMIDHVVFWGGSFVPRRKTGGKAPSNHSFGTAFDINPIQNPFGGPLAPRGSRASLYEIAAVLADYGFAWGGNWKRNKDGMHFEVSSVWKPKAEPVAPAGEVAVVIDGRVFDNIPTGVRDGTLWVGGRAFMAALKVPFGWVPSAKVITVDQLPLTTEMRDGVAWIMPRQVCKQLNLALNYNPKTRVVEITK